MQAAAMMAVPQKSVSASRNWRLSSSAKRPPASPSISRMSEMMMVAMMPMPEMGLEDEPISPAM